MRSKTHGFEVVLPSPNIARPFARGKSGRFNLSLENSRATTFPSIQEVGELINEDQIILGGEESKGLSIKGHYPKKDGVITTRPQAKTVAARQSIGAPIARRIGVTLKRIKNQIAYLEVRCEQGCE